MTSLINPNQVIENRVSGSALESQISKVSLTGWTKRKRRTGNRLLSNAPEKISYDIFSRSMVPRLVNRCQVNCGDKLFPADKEDYLVMKLRACIGFMKTRGSQHSARSNIRGNRFINFSFNSLSFVLNKNYS